MEFSTPGATLRVRDDNGYMATTTAAATATTVGRTTAITITVGVISELLQHATHRRAAEYTVTTAVRIATPALRAAGSSSQHRHTATWSRLLFLLVEQRRHAQCGALWSRVSGGGGVGRRGGGQRCHSPRSSTATTRHQNPVPWCTVRQLLRACLCLPVLVRSACWGGRHAS